MISFLMISLAFQLVAPFWGRFRSWRPTIPSAPVMAACFLFTFQPESGRNQDSFANPSTGLAGWCRLQRAAHVQALRNDRHLSWHDRRLDGRPQDPRSAGWMLASGCWRCAQLCMPLCRCGQRSLLGDSSCRSMFLRTTAGPALPRPASPQPLASC